MAEKNEHQMACMEVWGGNSETDVGLNMVGLDAWIYCKPFGTTDKGGGDVHYVTSCASGAITRLLLADVSGHGKAVAGIADRLRGIMQKYVNRIDQKKVLLGINGQFQQHSPDACFATALLLTFFAPREQLTLSNAGHPDPLIFRHDINTWQKFVQEQTDQDNLSNVPLGIFKDANYCQQRTRLDQGDMVFCYSDALIEAKKHDGRLLGTEGLHELMKELPTDEPNRIIPDLLDAIDNQADLEQDDLTAILIRRSPQPIRIPVKRALAAPARVLWANIKKLTPETRPTPDRIKD